RGVEVGVADRGQLVRAAGRVALVERGEQRAGPPPRRPVRGVPGVADAIETGEQLARKGGVDALLELERAQDAEVEAQPPGVRVEARELAAVEQERRARPVRAVRALADDAVAERVVAGDLEREAQRLAAARRFDERRVRSWLGRGGVQALHGAPAHPQR